MTGASCSKDIGMCSQRYVNGMLTLGQARVDIMDIDVYSERTSIVARLAAWLAARTGNRDGEYSVKMRRWRLTLTELEMFGSINNGRYSAEYMRATDGHTVRWSEVSIESSGHWHARADIK